MNRIKILDCTLRDGGYVNQWEFGSANIKKIINGLIESGISLIECGFLTNKVTHYGNNSKFNYIEQFTSFIPHKKDNISFACMINYGEYDLDNLPPYNQTLIDSIRIAFHKKDMVRALEACRLIKEKGYKAYLQPMVSMGYTDTEFIQLINLANEISPYAFYIVDSFGVMRNSDLIRLFYLVEHNLDPNIVIGYHSHNNLQLSYSNACALAEIRTNRDIIIDSCIFGMGRGAGNLNTELFVEYLNNNFYTKYKVKPLLNLIDEVLNPIYQINYWGYSLAHYLSAIHNCHPNYGSFLEAKKTLMVNNMNDILTRISVHKKSSFDYEYIESLYVDYLTSSECSNLYQTEFSNKIKDNDVLLIAPGRSAVDEKHKVIETSKVPGITTISVNFDYEYIETDFIFVSNLRRFNKIDQSKYGKAIITSNINTDDFYLKISYQSLLNDVDPVKDNVTLMLVKFLVELGVKRIYIAGVDGFSLDLLHNYVNKEFASDSRSKNIEETNNGIMTVIKDYSKMIEIEFVTSSIFAKQLELWNLQDF